MNANYIPPDASRYLDDSTNEVSSNEDTDTEDELGDGGYVALSRTATHESIIEVSRPKGELFLVFLEELAVLAQLAVHVIILLHNVYGRKGRLAAICAVATWAYIAGIASLRLLLSSQTRLRFSRIWYHTAFLYCLLWIVNSLTFRSEIIHPRSKLSQDLTIADFALTSLLTIISLTSRKGNKSVKLEYEGDIEPSKEQIASVFSLATFGWVDAIVWKAYQKSFVEMSDVWNLAPRDKAANLLADYRQLKKTSSLAFHLLRYFKRGIIIQGLWAAISGFLTFAPTLLLKSILEYIEDPTTTPRNAAWFYVILLFVSGCVKAVADGQALWIGRKICIRLRAIVIGEIYAKALKRRIGTTSDKVLGGVEKMDDGSKPSFIRRILGLEKKKSPVQQAEEEAAATKKKEEDSDAQVTSGTIINLMSVDSFKVSDICAYLHFLWASTPVQFIGTIALLYQVLGYSSFVGIAMMGILLPVNMVIAKQFAKLQKEILAATDARINLTNEVLSNIRIIKFFAWEQRFMGLIDEKRKVELKKIFRRYLVWAFAGTVWSGAPIVITLLTFMIYTRWEKKDLIPSIAFTGLSLFQILRIPLDQLADMVAHVQESKVSVDRVEEYLSEPETDKFFQLQRQEYDDNGDPLIGFNSGTFSWGSKGDSETDAFKLLDLDFFFQPGQLNVIVGPTGSGKTSMLMALLGEMTLLGGFVHLPGAKSREDAKPDRATGLTESIAYCAQQAWLINASIKDNIVFASPWDPVRYKDVIIACSLQRDLEILDAGDETLVGEKGVTLSGGQKQRISLARALYSRARHILLDDVLSAVDSHTAKWIFENAILGPLMQNRTCILVTHSVSLCLPHADFGVVLENGRIVCKGTLEEIVKAGVLSEDMSKSLTVSQAPSGIPSRVPSEIGDDSMECAADKAAAKAGLDNDTDKINTGKPVQMDHEEKQAVGGVKLAIILLYFAAMGSWLYWTVAVLVFIAQQLISVATNLWIREWANAYASKQAAALKSAPNISMTHISASMGCFKNGVCSWSLPISPKQSTDILTLEEFGEVNDWYYISVYAAIGLVLVISVFIREIVLFYGSISASKRIHTRLMESVMRAKFRFFDSTPLGQIMNRFSKDIEAIDQDVTPVAVGVMYCFLSIVTIIILISVITPGFLIAGAFISILYFAIGLFYINSSRDLKRLESVKRSPLYQQFGETLTGMVTIRAYGDERRFIRENLARINAQNRPFIFLWATNRWLAFRIDVVGSLVSFFSAAFVILSVGRIDPGAAGLAMTYAVTYTDNMLWFVRLYAANEQNMNSVERIKEYLDVEQEAPEVIEENRPPGNWPSQGSIEFINYSTRYREDFDLVLKNLSFKVLPGEKVGVVGRTGAGKSSMALALFRALEAQEGKILVDDVDIGLIGLRDLREKVVMVPQDPTLFSGTIRSNLDPFGLFTDEEIFTSLRRTQLVGSPSPSATLTPTRPATPIDSNIEFIVSEVGRSTLESSEGQFTSPSTIVASSSSTTTPDDETRPASNSATENKNIFLNLSSPITESGSNLSQGQRQLLCLARALLKEPAVLLMDEATASIDHATDSKIQETIRRLENTTVTIAHRLKTIVDYDKVLVLDHGKVIEYGEPWELIKNEDGMFRGMCEGSGEMSVLLDMADKAKEKKGNSIA
jgi:ABC-type multidrug transport system fused ATPase/permease subunit